MADEHDGAARRHHRQHRLQILAQLLDGVRIRRRLAGLTVSTLVVEHHPHLRAPLLGQPGALKMEGAHAKTEAVGEDHRQRGVFGPHLANRQGTPSGVVTTTLRSASRRLKSSYS